MHCHALEVNMAHTSARQGGWLTGWEPEDEDAWHEEGHRIAAATSSALSSPSTSGSRYGRLWSVLVLLMSPEIGLGFGPGEKFLLVATPIRLSSL